MSNLQAEKQEGIVHSDLLPRRRKRIKIFQGCWKGDRVKEDESEDREQIDVPKVESKIYGLQVNGPDFVKVPKKQFMQASFLPEQPDEEAKFPTPQLLPSPLGLNTVGSQKFGITGEFKRTLEQPFVFIRGHSKLINEKSELFKSVSELKESFAVINHSADLLTVSVRELQQSVSRMIEERESDEDKLRKLEEEMDFMRREGREYDRRIEELDQRMDAVQLKQSAMRGQLGSSEEEKELKMFIQDRNGKREQIEQEEDQFAETQFLPAYLIAEFIEMRKKRSQQHKQVQRKEESDKKSVEALKGFHPCLNITAQGYDKLAGFILQQFPQKKIEDISLQLLYRRSTVDLDRDSIGQKQQLQYKENLVFIIRSSFGKVLGGFISNYFIEEQLREDRHAFLFSMEEGGIKFKVKKEHQLQAYESSKHYLICFGCDLMLSESLEEESYCEWPNIYNGDDRSSSMSQLAAEFSFMVEHIEIYQVNV